MKRPRAVALLSGGLDSTLAILVLLKQGIDVTAITFLTHFGCDITDKSSCSKNPFPAAEKFGFEVKLCHLGEKFLEIVKNPKFGHGKNMNPCIDCRILMLKEAKAFMEMIGADFLVTGEVLGQRPMSQRRECFPLIDKEAGVEGLVLRPLSAKLLPPTIPEQKGLVDRQRLYDFKGRTRKPQMALAKELGLTDYPSPAGGCLLTEPTYSYRLRELLLHNPDPSIKELNLLRVGRHFRLSPLCKAVVGRNHQENETILSYATSEDILMRVLGVGSPVTIITGTAGEKEINIAASITSRYSDARGNESVKVRVFNIDNKKGYEVLVSPATETLLEQHRIYLKEPSKKIKRKKFEDQEKVLV
jgi:tRNA U34 2-thiouridine synthase MnmA/TrmU